MSVAITLAVVVQLSNIANAPPPVVALAQTEVSRVYAAIGVPLRWQPVGQSTDPHTIRIMLLPMETGELRHVPDTVMGVAMRTLYGTSVAYVFYRRVEQEAHWHDVSSALVLAYAMSHELGHLLLGSRAHSPAGLMRACWRRAEFQQAGQGRLRFSEEEASAIRAWSLGADARPADRLGGAAGCRRR